jgi:hypothetical protein
MMNRLVAMLMSALGLLALGQGQAQTQANQGQLINPGREIMPGDAATGVFGKRNRLCPTCGAVLDGGAPNVGLPPKLLYEQQRSRPGDANVIFNGRCPGGMPWRYDPTGECMSFKQAQEKEKESAP